MLLAILLLLLLAITAIAQQLVWISTAGTTADDSGYSISVDTSTGDAYVTGSTKGSLHGEAYVSQNDIFLMKYAENGTRIWTKMVGTNGNDFGYGVSVDNVDNVVYVTGEIADGVHDESPVGGRDIILMKYSFNGTRIWTKITGTTSNDAGNGVVADENAGIVYMTGQVTGSLHGQTSAGSVDIFLMNYTKDGDRLWTKLAGTNGYDVGSSLSMDLSGHIYVTGSVESSLNGEHYESATDIFLMKFDGNDGTVLWTRMAGSSGDDYAYGVSVDTVSNSVYLTGSAGDTLDGQPHVQNDDIFVMKFSVDGTKLWTKLAGTIGYDVGYGVIADSVSNSVFVTGSVQGSLFGENYLSSNDIFLIKYAGDGTRVWTKLIGTYGNDIGSGVCVHPLTHIVYVTGFVGDSIDGAVFEGGYTDVITTSYVDPQSSPTGQPTNQPSSIPSGQPSMQPSSIPSGQPTNQPTTQPSQQPFGRPTGQPTGQPTRQPSSQPSSQPSRQPSKQPFGMPTGQPTGQPSLQPAALPTFQPSRQPSLQPFGIPTGQPTSQPSMQPSGRPSSQPSRQPSSQPSSQPSCQPSLQPFGRPTGQPTGHPSIQPAALPTSRPSCQPSQQPFSLPTSQPSVQPSLQSFDTPTGQPTGRPSSQPTSQPSLQPSSRPSNNPSLQPSVQPTSCPSIYPSSQPSLQPSGRPTVKPSVPPTGQPNQRPTSLPSTEPSTQPSVQPSGLPYSLPSYRPVSNPTSQPSIQPSSRHFALPTSVPTEMPSTQPSNTPTSQPTFHPSSSPSRHHSLSPTGQPTGQPNLMPTSRPSCQPSVLPSSQPTMQPTRQPSVQPSMQPTCQPSSRPTFRILTAVPSPSPSSSSPSSLSPTFTTTFFLLTTSGNTSIGSSNGSSTSVNASLAVGVLANLASNAAAVAIVTDTVRVVAQTLPNVTFGSFISISLPLTEEESALQAAGKLVLPSINLAAPVANGTSIYVAVAVISSILWIPPSRSGNSSSNSSSNPAPLAEQVGQLQSDVVTVITIGAGVSFVNIGFPAGTIAKINATPAISFTIYCPPRRITTKLFYCNDTGYTERVQCTGLASVVHGTCPRLQEACAALDLTSMTVARDNLCQTTRQNQTSGSNSTSDTGLMCRCGFGEGLNVVGSSTIAAGIVLSLGSSDLSKTFQASSAFGDGSAASKAAIVLSVFVSVWVIALVAVFCVYNWKMAEKRKNVSLKTKEHPEILQNESSQHLKQLNLEAQKLPQAQLMTQKLADAYMSVLFPAAFLPSSLLEGFCREVYMKHMYIKFFFRLHHSNNPIVDIVKVVTLQSFLLFLLALLYDLNVPSDDGSCKKHISQPTCLQQRLFFDPSLTYCQWTAFQYADLLETDDDAVYFECIYGNPVVSFTAATYTSMILSLATCLIMDPLEFILSLLAAPTLDVVSISSPSLDVPTAEAKPAAIAQHHAEHHAAEMFMTESTSTGTSNTNSSRRSKEPSTVRIIPAPLVSESSNLSKVLIKENVANAMLLKALLTGQQQPDVTSFYDITTLEAAIISQRTALLSDDEFTPEKAKYLAHFDSAWGLDSTTGKFLKVPEQRGMSALGWMGVRNKILPISHVVPSSKKNILNIRDIIEDELLRVQRDTLALIKELQGQPQTEIGFEVMVQFVQDVLGRHTAAARIFALKIDMDYEKLRRVSFSVKASICILLLCLNVLFFYFTILRGISKGLAWQRSYLIAWLLQSVVDICVFESMQVAWFHYFIPSLVKKEVAKAKIVLETAVEKAITTMQIQSSSRDVSELNAPDFLFVSNHLARHYPQCIESFLVKQYCSQIPGSTGASWQKLASSSVAYSGDSSRDLSGSKDDAPSSFMVPLYYIKRAYLSVGSIVVSIILQVVVFAPLEFQSLLTRAVEPVLLSGVLFLFLLASSRPVFLALIIVLLVALVVSVIWEHISKVRERRRVLTGNASVADDGVPQKAQPQLHHEESWNSQESIQKFLENDSFQSLLAACHANHDIEDNASTVQDEIRQPSRTSREVVNNGELSLEEAYSMSSSDGSDRN